MRRQYILMYLNKTKAAYFLAAFFLIIALFLGISIGTVSVSFLTIIKIFINSVSHTEVFTVDTMQANIVSNIRLPRVILAGLVGASLAIAGCAFQGLLRNPLADPYTLGVSSGASVGAVATLFFHITIPFLGSYTLPVLSIVTAFLTVFLVLLFAKKLDPAMKVETIILTGIIFSSFLGAFISLLIALTGDELRQIIGWLLGSVSMRGWTYIQMFLPFFIIGCLILLLQGRELNILAFGEERAQHLGVQVRFRKMTIILAGSMLTGAAVAVSGTIGFVGLVIPHLVRIVAGSNHRHVLPLSIFVGSGFLILADLLARSIISPAELPIGVITALSGAPVFAILLLNYRKKGR
ncbi:iron ABC transporter permease [Niallia sp. Man26]|uniref:FecCD family ABC transporter permease n=1 Tax=Niallia sp. Man26 TaxID=2912824 RepID=UPI0020576043|nr:iron ABC transporter permease [Niallia sp. Man26]UPO87930.1 iron ABC transporter permease [Niallia sp. Man26]